MQKLHLQMVLFGTNLVNYISTKAPYLMPTSKVQIEINAHFS